MIALAEQPPGTHPLTPVCGDGSLNLQVLKFYYCAFTLDTLLSSALAIAVTLAIAFLIRSRLTRGTPGKLQMALEFLLGYTRGLVKDSVAEDATFIIPIAATIALYILVANWLDFLPLQRPIQPANSDLNQTAAMALVVIIVVQWYSIRTLGLRGYLRRFTKPFEMPVIVRAVFVPLNVIEEIAKPITLALRLFGNIFAGILMVYLLTLFTGYVGELALKDHNVIGFITTPLGVAGLIVWKFFDVVIIGAIQAFIFFLLTIIYFGMAREGLEEEGHGPPARRSQAQEG